MKNSLSLGYLGVHGDVDARHRFAVDIFSMQPVRDGEVLRLRADERAWQQLARSLDAEHVLEALAEMRVEVVEHQMDSTGRGIDLFQQAPDERHEIRLGAVIGNLHGPSSAFGLDRHEQIARRIANVLIVQAQGCSRPDGQRRARILEQLLVLFAQANDGFARPKWPGVQVEQIVHPLSVLLSHFAEAPHQLAPRFDAQD